MFFYHIFNVNQELIIFCHNFISNSL